MSSSAFHLFLCSRSLLIPSLFRFTVHYSSDGLPTKLTLPAGAQRHHLIFHHKCAAHTNNQASLRWLLPGNMAICNKSCGQLVHFFGFITGVSETTHIALLPAELAALPLGANGITLNISSKSHNIAVIHSYSLTCCSQQF